LLCSCSDDDSAEATGPDTSNDGPVECQELTLPETAVLEEFRAADVVPQGSGGRLVDGAYELVGHVRHRAASSGETGSWMRAALRLRNGAKVIDYLFDEGDLGEPASPGGFTARVTTQQNVMLIEMVCPEPDATALGYTAAGNELSLFEGNEEMRFVRR
jgi:hypothetical protein